MDPITIEAGLTLAEQVVSIIVKAAPAIEAGITDVSPYVRALAGMLVGSNATQEQVVAMRAQLDADSADFQTPLPPDDGK